MTRTAQIRRALASLRRSKFESLFRSNPAARRTPAHPRCPVTRIPPEFGSHPSDVAVHFTPDVRFFDVPPPAGLEYTSPPGIGSSLINPPMKIISFPSGDHFGPAICMPGFGCTSCIVPEAASIENSPATYQLLSPFPRAAVIASCFPSGDQSNSYTYKSFGEICRTFAVAASTNVNRCSRNSSDTTPSSGVSATSGPAARVAFSVKSTAIVLPSGDHPGPARNPFRWVSCLAAPLPTASVTNICSCPIFDASERNAIRLLSPDHAMSCSSCAAFPSPAVIRPSRRGRRNLRHIDRRIR